MWLQGFSVLTAAEIQQANVWTRADGSQNRRLRCAYRFPRIGRACLWGLRGRAGHCDQRLTGLPSVSSTCTSPSLSARTGASIFFRSPTITQVIALGAMMSLMAACAAG